MPSQAHQDQAQTITDHLAALGWTPSDGTALASKTYPTAVGPKQAHAYFMTSAPSDPNSRLFGDYQSEGRNILEAFGLLVPKAAQGDELAALVEQFVRQADAVVSASYAYRLAH